MTLGKSKPKPIAGKVVAITGASRGIGAAMARAFANEGCKLALCATDQELLNHVAAICTELGAPNVLVQDTDITKEDQVKSWTDRVHQEMGPVEILINNAGILGPRSPIVETSRDAFLHVMEVNLVGAFLVTKAFLPGMVHLNEGIVVHISSELGRNATRNACSYIVSKWALEGFSRALAKEAQEAGIISVSVSPGMVKTRMLESFTGPEPATTAFRSPDEVGPAFVRLVRQLGPSQNGQTLHIDSFL